MSNIDPPTDREQVMSKKAQKAYLELSHAIADMEGEPQCADERYSGLFFVEPMPVGMPDSLAMRLIRQNEADAKLICDFCPVKALCASYAILAHEAHGVWGGTSPTDRKAIYASAKANALGATATPRLFE